MWQASSTKKKDKNEVNAAWSKMMGDCDKIHNRFHARGGVIH